MDGSQMGDTTAEVRETAMTEANRGLFASDEIWPLLVLPWVLLLALAGLVLATQGPARDADFAGNAMLVSLVLALVGLGLYALLVRMVPRRHFPRLRRGVASISTGAGFVGLTIYFGGFLLGMAAKQAIAVPPWIDPAVSIGLGTVVCVGWGLVLTVVAVYAWVTGVAKDRDAAAATAR